MKQIKGNWASRRTALAMAILIVAGLAFGQAMAQLKAAPKTTTPPKVISFDPFNPTATATTVTSTLASTFVGPLPINTPVPIGSVPDDGSIARAPVRDPFRPPIRSPIRP